MSLPFSLDQCPVPASAADCGELVALSVALRAAVADPVMVGLKAMEKVQLAPAARDVPQVLLTTVNSEALVPVKV